MSETFAAQLTAVATLGLAILALATAILAFLAWRKQSGEVRDQAEMLRLQAAEFGQLAADRERESQERRRSQAAQVYMWEEALPPELDLDPYRVVARVRNTSPQPVYGLLCRWERDEKPAGDMAHGLPLMPGEEVEAAVSLFPDTAPADARASVIFRDRAGIWWQAWPDGRLGEVPEPEFVPAPINPPPWSYWRWTLRQPNVPEDR
jgi:hypothetical protein